jgi:hypothetical protein
MKIKKVDVVSYYLVTTDNTEAYNYHCEDDTEHAPLKD